MPMEFIPGPNLSVGTLRAQNIISGSGSNGSIPSAKADFGAVGDGSHDDYPNLQNAYDAGGALWIPPGSYRITQELISSTAITILGSGRDSSLIFIDGDHRVSTFTAPGTSVYNMGFQGSSDFGAANANVTFAQGANNCHFEHNFMQQGRYALLDLGTDNTYFNNEMRYAFGTANVKSAGGSGKNFFRNKMDQAWPVSNPSPNTALNDWQANHAYSVGNIARAVAPGGITWIIQVISSTGNSGSSQPTLLNYEVPIIDNNVVWNVVAPETYYSFQMDSGASEVWLKNMNDHSGAFSDCIGMTNTGDDVVGADPFLLWVESSICGQQKNRAIFCDKGHDFSVAYSEINIGWTTADAEILGTQDGFAGNIDVSNNRMGGGNSSIDGVKLYGNGLSNVTISDNLCSGSLNHFVELDDGAGGSITDVSITDNTTGGSNIKLATNTDWITVTNNNTRGSGVDNGSAGGNNNIGTNI